MITILDQSMFADGPLTITAPGEYRLASDVRADATAIIVQADGVSLDLDGHEILYGDAPGSVEITWQPGAVTDDAPAGMGGEDWCFQLSEATPVARSWRITLPTGRPPAQAWRAAAQVRGLEGSEVTLWAAGDYGDASEGKLSGPAPARGFSVLADWFGSDPVWLNIHATSPDSGHVRVGHFSVRPLYDHGVQAGRVKSFRLTNGTIRQGGGRASAGHPVVVRESNDWRVENLQLTYSGDDTHGIDAEWSAGGKVKACRIIGDGCERVSNRMHPIAGVNLANTTGYHEVLDCTILGVPHVGIFVNGRPGFEDVVVRNNEIRQRAIATNGYGILLAGVWNADVVNNTVIPENGRGLCLDGWGHIPTSEVLIARNYLCATEWLPNLEYGFDALDPTALRLRCGEGERQWSHVIIDRNLCEAWAVDGGAHHAIACRLSYEGERAMACSMNNNTFVGAVLTSDPAYSATGLSVSRKAAGAEWNLNSNDCVSNELGLAIGDRDGWEREIDGLDMRGTVIRRLADYDRNFIPISIGGGNAHVRNVRIAETCSQGGAMEYHAVTGPNVSADVEVEWS